MSHADTHHSNPLLEAALKRIYSLHRKEMDFRLGDGPYGDLLAKLGNPHLNLPPVIHVAGTNGKGSTIAMLRAMAEDMGLTVHAYTSPHLFRFNERLRVSGKLINDATLLNAIDHINLVNGDAAVTFFEFTTALAFHLFANHPADLVLLETGMGGRLDCSNVVSDPAVTIITAIGFDHMEYLGHTLENIAFEKAGIMKPNTPCILAPQFYSEAVAVFQARAEELGCPLIMASPDAETPIPSLSGAHQRDNMAAALAAFSILYPDYAPPSHLQIDWPGRFQNLNAPFSLLYDGAHNADSFRVLADTLTERFPDQPIVLILAMQGGKDINDYLKPLQDAILYTVDLPIGRKPQSAAELALQIKLPVAGQFQEMQDAIKTASSAYPDHVIVIVGSLYAAQLIPDAYWPKMAG